MLFFDRKSKERLMEYQCEKDSCTVEDCFLHLDCAICKKPLNEHETVGYALIKMITWHCNPQQAQCIAIGGGCLNKMPDWFKEAMPGWFREAL